MFIFDDKEINELQADLKVFKRKALPFATRNTLNQVAFLGQKLARRDVAVKMILRNKFTIQSIRVNQSRTLDIDRQTASIGSVADYMHDQEQGGVKIKRGSEGVSIPTGYSAGQEGMGIRTRLPRRPNKLANIRLRKTRKVGSNRKQWNITLIQGAAASGNKYVFLNLGKSKGIFKVLGSKRRPRIKMVHNMSLQSVNIPRNPWLKPASDTAQVSMGKFYKSSLRFQFKKHGIFLQK